MKDNYYLALADKVELGNKIIIKRTITKLFTVATILLIKGSYMDDNVIKLRL